MRIGILELLLDNVTPSHVDTVFGRIFRRQLYSIMPQAIAVWSRELGHNVFYATYFGQSDPIALLPDDLERGQVIAKKGSVTPHTKFKGEIYVLSKDEGGRHTPFFSNYRPQFYFRTTDVTGSIKLPDGVEMVMPGDNVELEVELITPIAMEKTMRFAIREGGRTVGAGRVADIID